MESVYYLCALNDRIGNYQIIFAVIGLTFVAILAGFISFRLYEAVKTFIIPTFYPTDLRIYGSWAAVTGGSSGIFKSYACELAKRGMNVVVISNELEALKLTVDEIKSNYGVECCYVHVDFTSSEKVYDYLISQLKCKDIGIFVNGAGIDGNSPCYFLDETGKNVLIMIELHVKTITNLTRKVLNLMSENGRGIIVNVSSMASLNPLPFWSTYSACKSFTDRLTRAISWENKENGVKLQSVSPFFVATRMLNNKPFFSTDNLLIPTTSTFCKYAVSTLGIAKRTTGYWVHGIIWFFSGILPDLILNLLLIYMMKMKKC